MRIDELAKLSGKTREDIENLLKTRDIIELDLRNDEIEIR